MHVTSQSEAVFEVRFGLVVLDLTRVDLRVEKHQPPGDAVLFFLEEIERDGSGVVSMEQTAAFFTKLVSLGGEGVPRCFVRGVEVIELPYEHLPERDDDVFGYLHARVCRTDR